MNWKIKTRSALIILMLFFTSGCAPTLHIYAGPEKPDTEIAHIQGGGMTTAQLFKVDEYIRIQDAKYDVAVLPGEHVLEFFCFGNTPPPPYKITFRAEAGKRYIIDDEKDIQHIYDGKTEIAFAKEKVPAYQEPTQGDAAILVLKTLTLVPFVEDYNIILYRIDGKYPNLSPWDYLPNSFNSKWGKLTEVKLTPGEHILEYKVRGKNAYAVRGVQLKIVVEAGKRYTVKISRIDKPSFFSGRTDTISVKTEFVEDK